MEAHGLLSGSELPSWLLKSRQWITCTFEGLGTKKQAYLDLLNKGMVEKGFRQFKKIKSPMATPSLISKTADLIYKTHDEQVWLGIKVLPKGEDLRTGFTYSDASSIRTFLTLLLCVFLGAFAGFSSSYIISGGSFDLSKLHPLIAIAPVGIFILVTASAFGLIFGRPQRTCEKRAKAILIETAESMGSKQVTPFENTAADLETTPPSQSYRVITMALKLAAIIALIIFILLLLLFPKPWGT